MDLTVYKDSVSKCEQAYKTSAEHTVDLNITLPDYMPDIVRILRCDAVSGVQTHQVTGDRITAECDCLLKVLYICKDGKANCYDQTIHFGKQLEFKNDDNINDIYVGAKTEYINYRVNDAHSFEIHGAISVFASANIKKDCEFASNAEGDGVAIKQSTENLCNLTFMSEKIFTVSEECEINSPTAPIGTIIESYAYCRVDNIKVIQDKIFVKGSLIVSTAYLSGDDNKICCSQSFIDINRIIEANGITENSKADVNFNVLSLYVRPKFDSSGDKSYIDVSATINVSAKCYEIKQIKYIEDSYSTKYDSHNERTDLFCYGFGEIINDSFLQKGIADFKTTGILEICSFICTNISSSFAVTENGYCISGTVTADIIYKDSKGELSFAQRQIPFEYKKDTSYDCKNIICIPQCNVNASNYVLNDNDTVETRMEINVCGIIFLSKDINVISDIEINKDKLKESKTAALTIYFADENENLWDIAEKYNTTVEAILSENNIKDTVLKKDCKLLIPKI